MKVAVDGRDRVPVPATQRVGAPSGYPEVLASHPEAGGLSIVKTVVKG